LKNRKTPVPVILTAILVSASLGLSWLAQSTPVEDVTYVGGVLGENQTWSGHVFVGDWVKVPEGVTLTIEPGTFVEFGHYRGYKRSGIGLSITGGTVKAIGTPEERIWFTSASEEPINGDWAGISCEDTDSSEFEYVVVEFAMIGIEQFGSSVKVSHSTIRWTNTEGLYAERSRPVFEHNLIYGNAYHEIALEQYNYDVQIRFNIFEGGHCGVHCEATNATIQGNYFLNYTRHAITAGAFSNLTIAENKFENITGELINLDSTTAAVIYGNDYGEGTVPIPDIGFEDIVPRPLGYIPGDLEDQYLYVYDPVDETRRVIGRLDNETTFGWSLTYANGSLWRFDHRSSLAGQQQDFVKIDPSTGDREYYGNDLLINPRGLCYDGELFWANDFTLRRIYGFGIDDSSKRIEIKSSFPIPEAAVGGLLALATDGTHLYTPINSALYKLEKSGEVVGVITGQPPVFGGPTIWTGDHFWSASGTHWIKWHPNGTLAGAIYAPAWETIGLAWDGGYLWSVQKTCELWLDGKVFQVEVLDDQFLLPEFAAGTPMLLTLLFLFLGHRLRGGRSLPD